MGVRILTGDCRDVLKTLPDESVHCVVTSPPYWGLRDYGVAGQLGMEATYQEHVATMADVFDEVKRVLRRDGTLWLNYGDSYATSVNGRSAADTKAAGNDDRTFRDKPFSTIQGVLKPKDLCGIPWRVAFALQERGWWLRQDIIWSKPNPMPESIGDRCTKAHEYLFLLAKSARYYFDADAIAETMVYSGLAGQDASGFKDPKKFNGKHGVTRAKDTDASARNPSSRPHSLSDFEARNNREYATRNKRSVWEVPTAPYADAHFATFPPALIEPCIKAGCPKGGTVLDPFFGAGTTGLVADRLGRDCIGIELNPAYALLASNRVTDDAPMFAEVTAA
jgi:DNA modification methylase